MKLYVILEKALRSGMKMAQGIHAAILFGEQYPHLKEYWFHESNNVAVLHVDDLPSLADLLEAKGIRIARFHEPDLNNQLTAIAAEPAAERFLSSLQLAA